MSKVATDRYPARLRAGHGTLLMPWPTALISSRHRLLSGAAASELSQAALRS